MPNNNLLRQTIGLEKIASSIIFDRSIIKRFIVVVTHVCSKRKSNMTLLRKKCASNNCIWQMPEINDFWRKNLHNL